jgi:hypothetical protein
MSKALFAAALTVALSAHAFSRKAPAPQPSASPSPLASPSLPAQPGNIQFKPVDYYTTVAQRAKIKRAGALVNQVLQSECAKRWLTARKMIDTDGMHSAAVAENIKSLIGVVPVEMYSRCLGSWPCTSAVAYRNVGSPTIHLNSRAFELSDPDVMWARTMAHEGAGHALGGYGHSFKWTPQRDYSVPYSLGGSTDAHGGDLFDHCKP